MKLAIKTDIEIPEGTEVKIEKGLVSIKGSKGEVSRKLLNPRIQISQEDKKIVLLAKKATKREKTMIGTFKAHIKNMIKGTNDGCVYRLKICSSHFPMSVSLKDNEFIVQNFLGESVPRTFKLKPGVDVKIEGEIVTVESPDKELAGQTAASIEQLCRITNRDRRIFQDGIYITEKDSKEIK